MIYPQGADSLMLWPRLLRAAEIDSVLREALEDLMGRGAALRLQHPSGGLQLSAGQMPQTEYATVRTEHLQPRGAKMQTILARARDGSHPWLDAVMQTYMDLDKRCQRGTAALQAAGTKLPGSQDQFSMIAQALLDRSQLAHLMAQAIWQAGYSAYWDHANRHGGGFLDLIALLQQMKLPHRAAGIAWPVQTSDGHLWVVDDPDIAVCRVDLGQGMLERGPEEPVVTFGELANIISLVEVARNDWTRGVG